MIRPNLNPQNSIGSKFNSEINKCDICFNSYDRGEHQPLIICSMHHTLCRECMKSLQLSRKCPFCRQDIAFNKVVINNYIYSLLPELSPQQNKRFQASQQNQHWGSAVQPARQVSVGVNNMEQQHIYPQNYEPVLEYEQGQYPPPPFDTGNCINSIIVRLGLQNNSSRTMVYAILLAQVPFMIVDLFLAFNQPYSECMDKAHVSSMNVFRPWLYAMGFIALSTLVLLLIGIIIRSCLLISVSCMQGIETCCAVILGLRLILWSMVQFQMFLVGINPYCSGGVYAYGLILFILHSIFLLIFFCMAACSKRR